MKINLRVDYNGSPYLELRSSKLVLDDYNIEDELMEFFIKEGLKKGIFIRNESFNMAKNDHASIRIKKPSPKDILFAENKEEEK